ncbi:aminotransferase class V-fold PLP-dependent enzyme [Streptomyces sp. NPDC058613]|uniref:aminotransferase class V-fold PLP-dependent enzyme n=1 Tax=Streptomyces sp. NPDC058613 TaxID=3346556 RepID=UPI003660673D
MNAPTHHGQRTAHLDAAGSGPMPDAVRAVLADCTARDDHFGARALDEHLAAGPGPGIRERLGRLLGVPARDTLPVTGAADAFDAFLARLDPGPRDRIWTTPHEGVAQLTALHALRDRTRCRLDVVPLRPDGDLDLDWMRAHIGPDVALVSAVHVSAACGTANPVHEIGRILAPHHARYAVDASHSAGQLPLDAARIGCDLLTADGWRFLRGPQDTGFAYTRPEARDTSPTSPTSPGGPGAPARPAPGQPPVPAPAAVAALNTALAHHAAAPPPLQDLLPRLRAVLERTPGVELLPAGRDRAGILAFRHHEVPAARLRRALARHGAVLAKTVAQEHPLHPAAAGGAPAVRASVHRGTTAQDIDHFARALRDALREERHTPTAPAPAPAAALAAAAGGAGGRGRPSPYAGRTVRRGHLTLHSAT